MRYDHFSMLPELAFLPRGKIFGGGMTLEGGGSAPSAPTATSTTTIPEYAQPYMSELLGKAEALTGAPYQAYKGERITQATPEQLAARQDVAGMTGPSQFGAGTQMATQGGFGALQAGDRYLGAMLDPNITSAFMSPYMQNVVDVNKAAAIRDAQRAQLDANLGAARQGTYGGARQLLATTEREKNLASNLAAIQAQGTQSAYEQAIKNMQFGTQAGLQGAATGIQGAQALGQLGQQQQASGLELAKAQEAFGSLGQAEKQRALDMAYQDFISQQQYPYKQLGFMSDLLRGSSNLAATGGKTIYEQPPSLASSLVGPGLLGLGLYQQFGKPTPSIP